MSADWDRLAALVVRHKGKVLGTLLGLVLGWLTIRYGILRALLVAFFIVAGFYVGARLDTGQLRGDLQHWLDRLFQRGGRL